jgi:hypothetical protein
MKNYIIPLFLILSLFFAVYYSKYIYKKSKCYSCDSCEGFTPGIRESYRPYLRNTTNYFNDVYQYTSSNIHNFFRKFRLI